MRTGRLSAGIAALLIALSASAEAKRIDYGEARETALDYSRLIKAYEAEAKGAEYRRRQAVGAYLPKINLSETYTSTDEPANAAFSTMAQGEFDMPYFMNQLADPDRIDNFRTKIEVLQPVYMQGKIRYSIKQAKLAGDASNLTTERVRQNIIYNLNRAFFGTALAEKALDVVRTSEKRTRRYYEMTKDFYENGLVVKSDLLVAETYLLMNEQARKDAKKELAVAVSHLQRLLDTDEDLSIIWEDPGYRTDKSLNEYIDTAITERQDLAAMEKHEKAAQYEVDKSKGAYLPEVAVFADYQRNDEEFLGDSGEGVTFGAQLKLNLFNGGADHYKIKENKAKHLAMLHRVADKRLAVKSEVKSAFYGVEAASAQLDAARKRVESTSTALEITENRFREGLAKITELLDREVDLQKAELSLYMSEYQLIISRAGLLYASGELN